MPSLTDIRTMIRASSADDWEVPLVGPTYLNAFGMVSDASRQWMEQSEHYHRAAYRPDVSLGLAWGLPASHADDRQNFPWSDRFIDRAVDLDIVDVLWNGMLIDRREIARVDGGRGTLPYARSMVIDSGQTFPEVVGETTNPYDVHLARLTHVLGGGRLEDFEEHFRRSGIVELPDEEP
jgi:hypothetical protein